MNRNAENCTRWFDLLFKLRQSEEAFQRLRAKRQELLKYTYKESLMTTECKTLGYCERTMDDAVAQWEESVRDTLTADRSRHAHEDDAHALGGTDPE